MIKEKENEPSYYVETNPYRGLFVCLEGIDNSGKTTQRNFLKKYLEKRNISFAITEEHNQKFSRGIEIQEILEGKKPFPSSSLDFQKLYIENRSDHLKKLIIPSLMKGNIVITDRYFWSTFAYGLNSNIREELIRLNSQFIAPDVTFILNIPPQISLERKITKGEREEIFDRLEKQKKISQAYEWIKLNFKNNIYALNGKENKNKISNEIADIITQHPKFYNSERIK